MDDAYILEYDELSEEKVSAFHGFRRYKKVLAACIALILTVFAGFAISSYNMSTDNVASQGGISTGPVYPEDYCFTVSTYDKYVEFLEEAKPKVKPDLIRFSAFDVLGEFDCFVWWGAPEADYSAYYYSLTDPNGVGHSIYIYQKDKEPEFKYTLIDSLPEGMSSMCDLGQAYDFSPAYKRNGLQYCYLRDGRLNMLRWEENGFVIHLSGDWREYLENAHGDTLVQRLLSLDDAVAAAVSKELKNNIKASREATQWEYIWDIVFTWLVVILALLLAVVLILWDRNRSKRYFEQHGKKRPFSTKRYLFWCAVILFYVILLMLVVDIYFLPHLDGYVLQDAYQEHKLFLPGIVELCQIEEGMTYHEVIDLLGKPQRNPISIVGEWDLYFGGTIKMTFDGQILDRWEITWTESRNGWYLPGILLSLCLLGFCFYRIIISGRKRSKRRCIIWMAIVLVFVFTLLLLVDSFMLPQYKDHGCHQKLFHLQALNFGKVTNGMKFYEVEEIIGSPQRYILIDQDCTKFEWDLPFGGVFWMIRGRTAENGIKLFASTGGCIVPGVMLITVLTEMLIYGYLFHPQWFQKLLCRRKSLEKLSQ